MVMNKQTPNLNFINVFPAWLLISICSLLLLPSSTPWLLQGSLTKNSKLQIWLFKPASALGLRNGKSTLQGTNKMGHFPPGFLCMWLCWWGACRTQLYCPQQVWSMYKLSRYEQASGRGLTLFFFLMFSTFLTFWSRFQILLARQTGPGCKYKVQRWSTLGIRSSSTVAAPWWLLAIFTDT